jgi:prepilin-type processing-associated H-X9-DG protein
MDSTLPLAFGTNTKGAWRDNEPHDVPPGWSGRPEAGDAQFWANSIKPFAGELPLACQAQQVVGASEDGAVSVGLTYNGFLHRLRQSAIATPAATILLWEGYGRGAVVGTGISNPRLDCSPTSMCLFGSAIKIRADLPSDLGASNTIWVHGKGANFLFLDGHAAWRRLGAKAGVGKNDRRKDPFMTYDKNGVPRAFWYERKGHIIELFTPR